MKAKRGARGAWTLTGVPDEMIAVLAHLAGDLGARNCVLRYDERLYDKWARPNKAARDLLLEFAALDGRAMYFDWDDHFDQTDRPSFRKEAIR